MVVKLITLKALDLSRTLADELDSAPRPIKLYAEALYRMIQAAREVQDAAESAGILEL